MDKRSQQLLKILIDQHISDGVPVARKPCPLIQM